MILDGSYQSVYRNLINGLRACPILGTPFGNVYTDIREAHIDIYMASGDNSARATKNAYGVIIFKEKKSNKTIAQYRLLKRSIYKLDGDVILNSWQMHSEGINMCSE